MTARASAAGAAAALLLLAAAATFGSIAHAGPSANVLDRTFRCTLELEDEFRTLSVSAHAGYRERGRPGRWRSVAHANLWNGARGLAGVGAGRPKPPDGSALLWVSAGRCRAANAAVALTRRGLPIGGAPTRFGDLYECQAGRTILLRVRAELVRPSRLKRDSLGVLATSVPVVRATVATRTEAGKLLALAAVSEDGSARLHVSTDCFPD